MARDKAENEVTEKREKKDKKRKADDTASAEPVTKKSKKDKKRKSDAVGEDDTLLATSAQDVTSSEVVNGSKDVVPLAALVPFANPLADDKNQKKVLKAVKKAAKHKTIKRGVKECVKSIRKSPPATPASLAASELPNGIVILAADISPMDVISHIPVLCEDHNIPYIYVPSRAELGMAGSTKRPTSVVMVTPSTGAKKGKSVDEDTEDWSETYKDLHKLAVKLGQHVKV